jgi:hypothetical protein
MVVNCTYAHLYDKACLKDKGAKSDRKQLSKCMVVRSGSMGSRKSYAGRHHLCPECNIISR